jgi:hypothetical protein
MWINQEEEEEVCMHWGFVEAPGLLELRHDIFEYHHKGAFGEYLV